VRCKLATVLLSQRDFLGRRAELSAAAALPGRGSGGDKGGDDQLLLAEVARKLQVAWPML
jgi:hypothetical protein